jgi:hypothetical protein
MLALTGTLALAIASASPALAQTAPDVNERLANQADRISSGIRDGSLTSGEATRLEREQSAVAREEARFLKDGALSDAERARLQNDLNRTSQDIYSLRHDAQANPNPNNPIDQRRANEEKRIAAGIRDDSLTPNEAARLQRQQTHISREEARFKSDGTFTQAERRHIVRDENRASGNIYRQRHDAQRSRQTGRVESPRLNSRDGPH